MILFIIAISLIFCALSMKLIFFKRAGFKSPKRFYSSIFKWYNQKNIWEVQGIKPRAFMKISNGFNILLWLGLLLLLITYLFYKF